VVVQRRLPQHAGIEHDLHHPLAVIDHGEGRDRAGNDAEMGHKPLGAAEGDAPRTDALTQRLEIDRPILQRHHQPHLALLVAQEEALAMAARKRAAQALGLLDGEDGRVLDRVGLDPELGQTVEEPLLRREGGVRADAAFGDILDHGGGESGGRAGGASTGRAARTSHASPDSLAKTRRMTIFAGL
jgi:hypothetical protein